jgi:glycosyltransferase involved in cell wall biosynthesis
MQSNAETCCSIRRRRFSLVTTVLNERRGCAVFLESLKEQTRRPDEVIVVDGGSTDGTVETIRQFSQRDPSIRLIEAPGANIGTGRNIGVLAASGDVILSTDAGCRLDARWVEQMARPFEEDAELEFAGGTYRVAPCTLLEAVIGAATMRGELESIDPERFNPSCRSMAYTKALWQRAGGLPDWTPIDDSLFNYKLRRMKVRRCFVRDAVVHWRPRSTLRGVYRQFRFYASTTGHTQLDARGTRYNLRNLGICAGLAMAGTWHAAAWLALAVAVAYFYVYVPHDRARRVAAKLGNWRAYPLCLLVLMAVILGDAAGYLRATVQRWRNLGMYRRRLDDYLSVAPSAG